MRQHTTVILLEVFAFDKNESNGSRQRRTKWLWVFLKSRNTQYAMTIQMYTFNDFQFLFE